MIALSVEAEPAREAFAGPGFASKLAPTRQRGSLRIDRTYALRPPYRQAQRSDLEPSELQITRRNPITPKQSDPASDRQIRSKRNGCAAIGFLHTQHDGTQHRPND